MPVFGHSDNHAGIQAADLLCSAFLTPMAVHAYCLNHINNLHVHDDYHRIRSQFGERLKNMQFRYENNQGRWRGGVTVSDALCRKSGGLLFAAP